MNNDDDVEALANLTLQQRIEHAAAVAVVDVRRRQSLIGLNDGRHDAPMQNGVHDDE